MQLSELNLSILHLLNYQTQISITDMSYQLQTNIKKLRYELDKISHYVNIENDIVSLIDAPFQFNNIKSTELIFSEKDRIDYMTFYLLCENDYISLEHITSLLNASRNTVLNDLKILRKQISLLNGKLIYDRTHGYSIQMHHEDKDLLLINLLYQCANKHQFSIFIRSLYPNFNDTLYGNQVCQLERANKVTLTDAHRHIISIALALLEGQFYRSQDKNLLIQRLFESHSVIHNLSLINDVYAKNLLSSFIQTFEVACGVVIHDKEDLIEKLMIHLYPSVLRAKYKINTTVDAESLINEHLKPIYTLTKYSISSIENALDIEYSSNEIALWALYFGSALRSQGTKIGHHKVACVLCPNGLAVSHAITEKLKTYFPMLNFVKPSSISQIKSIEKNVDIIFSTHAVESSCPVYLISQKLDQAELQHLGQKIFNTYQIPFKPEYDMNDLIEVIKEHTTIHNEVQLIKSLKSLFKVGHYFKEGYQPMLKELLTEQFIQTNLQANDWQSSISIASQPLLDANIINENYIHAMIETVVSLGPYIVIMPEVAIPHARPESGAKEVGLSLATFETPITFPNDKIVKLMIVLSAKDQNTHLKALAELTEILGNEQYLENIKHAKSKEIILEIINQI